LPLPSPHCTQRCSLERNSQITKAGRTQFIETIIKSANFTLQKVVFDDAIGGTFERSEAACDKVYANRLADDMDGEIARVQAALATGGQDAHGLTTTRVSMFLQSVIASDPTLALEFLKTMAMISPVDPNALEAMKDVLLGRLKGGDFVPVDLEVLQPRQTDIYGDRLDADAIKSNVDAAKASIQKSIRSSERSNVPKTKLHGFWFSLVDLVGKPVWPVFGNNKSTFHALAFAEKPELTDQLVFRAAADYLWRTSVQYFFRAATMLHMWELALVTFIALEHKQWAAHPTAAVHTSLWLLVSFASVEAVGAGVQLVGAIRQRVFWQQLNDAWFVLNLCRIVLVLVSGEAVLSAVAAIAEHNSWTDAAALSTNLTNASTSTSTTFTTTTFTTTTTTGSATTHGIPLLGRKEAGAVAVEFAYVVITTCFGTLYYLLPHRKFGPLVRCSLLACFFCVVAAVRQFLVHQSCPLRSRNRVHTAPCTQCCCWDRRTHRAAGLLQVHTTRAVFGKMGVRVGTIDCAQPNPPTHPPTPPPALACACPCTRRSHLCRWHGRC
jgi:hypothetical protein